jgi:predicted RNA-binding Zn ribbon-like protein
MQPTAPWDGMGFVVGLLNTWDELEPDPELLTDQADVAFLLRRHGFADAAERTDDAELAALRSLRTRIRAAWEAGTPAEAAELLNALLDECGVHPRLSLESGAGLVFRWDRPGLRGRDFLPGLAAYAVLEELRDHGSGRLGICVAGPCRCVYVDTSKNRTRRYCCTKCADRTNAAAYRARTSADGDGRGGRVTRTRSRG